MSSIKQISPPDLTDLLNVNNTEVSKNINCVQIGIIESFESATQTATIRLALKQVVEILPDGTRILQEYPLLLVCPVIFLYGGAAFLSMPVQVGDNCIVLFNDREIDQWYSNGGVQTPLSTRKHDLSDAIALVGIKNLQTNIADYLNNGIRLSYAANSRIDLVSNAINTIAGLFTHTGNMRVTGECRGGTLRADNGATGTFDVVTVVNGIVTSGS
jgi:hypothetical protein